MDDRHHNPSNFEPSPDEAGRDAFERDDAFGEELLSAYLDGECTAGEQAEAEARIAANPELRQLVDDLRHVRASLEVLPQHRLEANFAERVLRRAEREVLTGDRTFAQAVAQKTPAVVHRAPSPATSTSVNRRERFGSSRPFLWSVAALAAAILILITNREPAIQQDKMARGPEATVAPASKSEKRSAGREQSIELSAEPQQEDGTRLADGLSDEQRKLGEPAATADDYGPSPPAGAANRLDSQLDQDSPAMPQPPREEFDAAKGFREESTAGVKAARGVTIDQPTLGREPLPSSDPADQPSNRDAAGATSEVDLESAAKDVRLQLGSARPAPLRARAMPAEPAAPQSDPVIAAPGGTVEEGAADLDQTLPPAIEAQPPAARRVDAANADTAFIDAAPAESLRVVQVLVGRDAWQSGAVTELLKKNRIEVLNTTSSEELTQPSPSGPSAADKESERGQSEAKRSVEFATQQTLTDRLELMVVSAPSAQVAATLQDFQQQDQIRVVQVTDASAPEQFSEQSARSLGLQRDRRGLAYGSGSLSQTKQAPGDRAGKKELNETLEAQPTDAKVREPASDAVNKDAQTTSGRADQRSAPKQAAAEKSDFAQQPALANEPAARSAARRQATTSEADKGRKSEVAPDVPAPSFGAAPAGTEGLEIQPGYGRGGAARYAVPTEAPTLRGGGFGGYGGARYGMGDTAVGKGASPATAPETPLGYGQRVTLQHPSNYGALVAGGMAGRAAAPTTEAATFSDSPSTTGSLGREQVLFFFHVVDTPLAAAADRANAAATPAGPLEAGKPLPAKADDTNATPVPAPAPGPGSR